MFKVNSPLNDAHIHLADQALIHLAPDILAEHRANGWGASVVNGTCEADWPRVKELARSFPDQVIASYGLHPWFVKERSPNWLDTLSEYLSSQQLCIGECGLDRWIPDHDISEQISVLSPQIALAARDNRPLTLHCIQAWGHLIETLRSQPLPDRGFLVHAFSGSRETAHSLLDLGAYFSYSPYFTHERKASIRELYAGLPLDRLLIETDAPSMAPPAKRAVRHLENNHLSHPANLSLALESLQSIRKEHATDISDQLCDTFLTFFGQN